MYTGDQRIDYSKLVDQQQHRLTDPFNRLNKAVNNITSTTKAAPAPRTAAAAASSASATPGPPPHVPAGQATATTAAAAVFDKATQALPTDIERLLQESTTTTRESPLEQDLVDDDDELWSAALGVADQGGQGIAAAAAADQPVEQDLIDDDDEEIWSAAFGGLAEEPLQPMQDLVDKDDEMWSAAFGGPAL